MPEQELREPLLGRADVVAGIGEGAGQVAGRLAALIGHVDIGHIADGELLREELRVEPVGLALPVCRGLDHLGDGPDDAVDAEGPELAAEVEARDLRLVDRFQGFERQDPLGHRRRVCGQIKADTGDADKIPYRLGAGKDVRCIRMRTR